MFFVINKEIKKIIVLLELQDSLNSLERDC